MRLANNKTRRETSLNYCMQNVYTATPFGTEIMQNLKPYMPGQEEELNAEFSRMEKILELFSADPKISDLLYEMFMETKDCSYTLERSENNTLSIVELYEMKNILIIMEKMEKLMSRHKDMLPPEFIPESVGNVLNAIDPSKERINTFYIYDEFSEKLPPLRKEKRNCEIELRKILKQIKKDLEKQYSIEINPKFEMVVPKANHQLNEKLTGIPEMYVKEQDYMNVTFAIVPPEEADKLTLRMEELNGLIEEVEMEVRTELSRLIFQNRDIIAKNCDVIGRVDFTMGKAIYAQKHKCVRPNIVPEHILEFEEGRNLELEDILISKGKEYCPVSISLRDGVSCITGANMGGKTISLKLVGMVLLLSQYGFFVPCKSATIGLSNFVQILIGDSQSLERGLSSFGSEMEELKEILDNAKEKSLILIDEIASGTNPKEGLALTRSLIDYLKDKPYIVLITTHFDNVAEKGTITKMQVVGLEGADFNKLDKEIKYANRRERIGIISKYMDYRLKVVESEEEIPKDALHIAKILGLHNELIEKAREFMK